jgi:hypothetical protein
MCLQSLQPLPVLSYINTVHVEQFCVFVMHMKFTIKFQAYNFFIYFLKEYKILPY